MSLSPSTAERDELIEKHQSYVIAIAQKIKKSLPQHVELEELIGFGTLGLVEAAERFDARRGVSFSTFSYYRIRGAVYDGLRQMGFASRSSGYYVRFSANANDYLQSATDDSPPSAANSATLDDDIAQTQNIIGDLIPIYLLSLDEESVAEIIDPQHLPEFVAEQRQVGRIMHELIAELPPNERELIDNLYFKDLKTVEIATQMGFDKSWISRLHKRIIQRLRQKLVERGIMSSVG